MFLTKDLDTVLWVSRRVKDPCSQRAGGNGICAGSLNPLLHYSACFLREGWAVLLLDIPRSRFRTLCRRTASNNRRTPLAGGDLT